MELKLINRGNEGEVVINGRLDSRTAPEAEKLLMQQTERFDTLILNMEKLEYISSAGLRIMRLLHIAMNKKGGALELKNVNKMVMEVFEMTGFAGLLKFI